MKKSDIGIKPDKSFCDECIKIMTGFPQTTKGYIKCHKCVLKMNKYMVVYDRELVVNGQWKST